MVLPLLPEHLDELAAAAEAIKYYDKALTIDPRGQVYLVHVRYKTSRNCIKGVLYKTNIQNPSNDI
jgi:hypothetical protein